MPEGVPLFNPIAEGGTNPPLMLPCRLKRYWSQANQHEPPSRWLTGNQHASVCDCLTETTAKGNNMIWEISTYLTWMYEYHHNWSAIIQLSLKNVQKNIHRTYIDLHELHRNFRASMHPPVLQPLPLVRSYPPGYPTDRLAPRLARGIHVYQTQGGKLGLAMELQLRGVRHWQIRWLSEILLVVNNG